MSGPRTRYIELEDGLYIDEGGVMRKLSIREAHDRLIKFTQPATAYPAEPGEDLLHVDRGGFRQASIESAGLAVSVIRAFAGLLERAVSDATKDQSAPAHKIAAVMLVVEMVITAMRMTGVRMNEGQSK